MHFYHRQSSLAQALARKFTHPSDAMVRMFEAIILSPQNIYYNDFPGSGKTSALIATCLNSVDPSIHETQALIICGTIDTAYYTYRKTMELLSLIDNNNIIVRYVFESVFGTEESIDSTPHVVIGIGRTIRAFQGNNFNMLRVVCIDDAETVVGYEAQKAFIRMLPPQCCVIFCTTNHTENLLTTVDSFGLSRKFIVNLTKRLPSNVKYNFITLNEEHEDYNPLDRYVIIECICNELQANQIVIFCEVHVLFDSYF